MKKQKNTQSILVKRWATCTNRNQDRIIFFRNGDFYDSMGHNGSLNTLAKSLQLTIYRCNQFDTVSIPVLALDKYVRGLKHFNIKCAFISNKMQVNIN